MIVSDNPVRALFLTGGVERGHVELLSDYLQSTRLVHVEARHQTSLPTDLDDYHVLIVASSTALPSPAWDRVATYVRQGGGCLGLMGAAGPLPELFGGAITPLGPETKLRLSLNHEEWPILARLPSTLYVRDQLRSLEHQGAGRSLLNTSWHYRDVTLSVAREEGKGRVCCTTLQNYADPLVQQFLYRVVCHLAGREVDAPAGVAILGYSPAVGLLHGLAVQEVAGLELRAVCDLNRERLTQAQQDFPGVLVFEALEGLVSNPSIDLVIVATPPNSHAELSVRLLRGGKHVVCEKPMCLSVDEAEGMIQAAKEHDRVLTCYQNRRWDADYLAIRQAVDEGLVGDPFYLETFVGGYHHPCHYWHSHRPISGGALYDWGAHYVDWILNLFPDRVTSVVGTSHKRVWHDVTNADQVRVQIRFAGGQEGEFLHSDVAAIPKPKWYLLGTEGAIVGHWNEVRLQEADPLFFLKQTAVPVTETLPLLTSRRLRESGSLVEHRLTIPRPRRFAYYLNVADHLLTGEPLAVTASSAARVVAVLETATRSAHCGGVVEVLDV